MGGIWWSDQKWKEKSGEAPQGRHPNEKVRETPEVVVFIPHTPGGILKERLQRRDEKMREAMGMRKVKFVERGGRSLQGLLCRSNPWREKKCGGKDCLVCQTEAKGKCRVESVVYEVECGKCKGEGKRRVYVGESGRSAWERGGEHLRAWRAKEEGSFLWKHSVNEHGDELGE